VLKTWTKPLVTMFSDLDPVTAGGFKPFQKLVPGAQNQPHVTIEGAGHFLQEDKGAQIAHLMNEFIAR
jgi:haloalkane dehalogenase